PLAGLGELAVAVAVDVEVLAVVNEPDATRGVRTKGQQAVPRLGLVRRLLAGTGPRGRDGVGSESTEEDSRRGQAHGGPRWRLSGVPQSNPIGIVGQRTRTKLVR